MRLATLNSGQLAAMIEDRVVPLDSMGFMGSMLDLIRSGTKGLERVRNALSSDAGAAGSLPLVNYAAPIPRPPKIIAIGLNYLDHARESNMDLPEEPLVFTKFSSSVIGHNNPVVLPETLTREVDYEVELGVVIGRTARNVESEEALDYVFGYTVLNDVSARDLQFADKQWVRGKSLDTFCPMGPEIVTTDEVPDPQVLRLGCSINGETLQDGNTEDMIFGVAELISRLSRFFILEPGDVIATGTPSGVGFSRNSPVFLKPGDELRTWIEDVGELVNPIVDG